VQTIAPPTNSPPIPASPPIDDPIVELPSPGRRRAQQFLTGVIVFGPLVAVAWVVAAALGGHLVALPTLAVAAAFYLFTVLGVTVGFHRLFTHRSFVARRPLKIALAVAGSMSFQGSVIGWVATHRRHHMYSDRAGDPHSPVVPEHHPFGRTRGFFHAHMGWFFAHEDTPRHRFAPDLLADRDLVWVDRLFVPLCIATLALPFGIGYALTGTLGGALSVLLWAGVLRVAFLHQITWSTNSVCHVFGRRPFRSGCCRWVSRGTTPITRSRRWRATAWTAIRSISRRCSSAVSSRSVGRRACAGPTRPASTRVVSSPRRPGRSPCAWDVPRARAATPGDRVPVVHPRDLLCLRPRVARQQRCTLTAPVLHQPHRLRTVALIRHHRRTHPSPCTPI
jgi:stearoyl-CoA desaturase (delta-9 desaturase)